MLHGTKKYANCRKCGQMQNGEFSLLGFVELWNIKTGNDERKFQKSDTYTMIIIVEVMIIINSIGMFETRADLNQAWMKTDAKRSKFKVNYASRVFILSLLKWYHMSIHQLQSDMWIYVQFPNERNASLVLLYTICYLCFWSAFN